MAKKPDIRIVDMRSSATMLLKRVAGTKGIFAVVGWNGEAVGVGEDVRKTLPHERVNVLPGMSHEDLVVELRLAAARIIDQIPDALEKLKRSKPKPKGYFTKQALYRKR